MATGQRIKEARKKAGMTQTELAEKLNIPFQSVSQWERNLRNPKYETLQRIAQVLDTSVSDLMDVTWEDAPSVLKTKLTDGESDPVVRLVTIEQCVFAILGELYKSTNEKMIFNSAGYGHHRYYVVGQVPKTFILKTEDIRLLTRWVTDTLKASMPALIEQLMDNRSEEEFVAEMMEGEAEGFHLQADPTD